MWLSKQLRQMRGGQETAADLGVTTIGGARSGGLCWRPRSGDRVVVLKGGPGGEETFVLGVQDGARAALADGEVYLYSGGASLCLRNDGTIELSGRLVINGAEYAPCACGATGIS